LQKRCRHGLKAQKRLPPIDPRRAMKRATPEAQKLHTPAARPGSDCGTAKVDLLRASLLALKGIST
jgi:hypothetical protein